MDCLLGGLCDFGRFVVLVVFCWGLCFCSKLLCDFVRFGFCLLFLCFCCVFLLVVFACRRLGFVWVLKWGLLYFCVMLCDCLWFFFALLRCVSCVGC